MPEYNNWICVECNQKIANGEFHICDKAGDQGVKYDSMKPKWHLMLWRELTTVVKVLTMGANKYSDDNWKYVDDAENRYLSASLRHISAWAEGRKRDKESGLSHLAHAICCLLFLMWFDNKTETENRAERKRALKTRRNK